MQFYGGTPRIAPIVAPASPVKLLFVTSVRDVGGDDSNGRIIRTAEGDRYMEGTVERTIHATRSGGPLHGILEVAGIVTDDLERDMQRLGDVFPVRPAQGRPWIHPLDLQTPDGGLVASPAFTHSIPSGFRSLPHSDVAGRTEQKRDWEEQVLALADRLGANVIVSDHLMMRIAHMIDESHGWFGRVLNIHPAITKPDHPCRFPGKTPTRDAIAQAAQRETFTGATLHIVDAEIDHGPILADIAATPVFASDTPMDLRYRNYQQGKLPLFIDGMRHYVRNILPHIDSLDLSAPLPPFRHVPVSAAA